MKDWRRPAVWLAAALALVAAAAAIAFHTLLDTERIRASIQERVKRASSRDLAIGGLSLSLFPVPSVNAREVTLGPAPGAAGDDEPLTAEAITAHLELLPLFRGDVRLKGLRIRNAFMKGDAKAKGRARWRIEVADVDAEGDMRDVRIDATIFRNDRPVKVVGRFEDLSRLGSADAQTPGTVTLDWGRAKLTLEGRFPMARDLRGLDVRAALDAPSLEEPFAFLGLERKPKVGAELRARLRERDGGIDVTQASLALGDTRVKGDLRVGLGGKRRHVDARLDVNRLDFLRISLDTGGPGARPRGEGPLFGEDPLPWGIVRALDGAEGRIDLKAGSVKFRNGLELRNVKTQSTYQDDRLDMKSFAVEALGGSATGSLQLDADKTHFRLRMDGRELSLERWFRERGSKVPFEGGPMRIRASIAATGSSLRELASTVSGPVHVRIGPGKWASGRAGEVESMMTNVFAPANASGIDFECIGAVFPFRSGRAESRRIAAARSSASQLMTSGHIDLREEKVDLRGRVKARSGVTLGLAAIAGEIVIDGPLRKPRVKLDETAAPAAIARVGAAIATAGATLVGSALIDAATTEEDLCALSRR